MLKLKTKDNKILLGIDSENVKRLKQGKPIRVKGSEIGIENDIYIAYGETIQDILNELGIAGIQ